MDMRLALFAILCIAALCAAGCTTTAPANTSSTATVTVTPCAACAANATPHPPANLTVDEQRLVAFVDEAAANARTNGREQALATFNDRNGSFIRGDLYVFAYDMNGTVLALPFQPEIVGTNRSRAVDSDGIAYIQDAIEAARNGSGFIRYHYPNPAHNLTVEQKTSYVVGLGDWFVGSGFYSARPTTSTDASTLSTREGLATFVKKAAAHAQVRGREAALADFNNRTGAFASGEVYVYALDYNGTTLALPFQPERVGTSFWNETDSTGQRYTQVECELARNGGGFVYYDYPNPEHDMTVEPKMSYVQDVDGTYWVGAGTYLPVANGTPSR